MSDGSVATIVSGVITITTMLVGFLTLWIKLKYNQAQVESKIEDNTVLTKLGTANATTSARKAESAATEAAAKASVVAEKTDSIVEKLNGGLEHKITEIVQAHFGPLRDEVRAHAKADEENMEEVRRLLHQLTKK